MYVPKQFRNNDASTISDFIRHHGFGILVSQSDSRMVATHIPLELSEDETKLRGHIAKANPQWKNFQNNSEVMVIFPGPHAYVSSSWYDHENVPTWNYMAVHVYGTIKMMEGEELLASLKELTNKYELHSQKPVTVDGMSKHYLEKEMRGIVGITVKITSLEASFKLSQNRDEKNHAEIVRQLKKRGDSSSANVAEEMLRFRKK